MGFFVVGNGRLTREGWEIVVCLFRDLRAYLDKQRAKLGLQVILQIGTSADSREGIS